MAGRFNFINRGAAMSATLREMEAEDELRRRTALQEQERAAHLDLAKKAEARAQAGEVRAGEAAKISADTAKAALARTRRNDALADVELAGPGGELTGESATRAKDLIPFMVDIRKGGPTIPGVNKGGLSIVPGVVDGPQTEASELAVMDAPEQVLSKGTRRQQVLKNLKSNKNLAPGAEVLLDLIDASGDDNLPASVMAGLFTKPNQPVFKKDKKGNVVKLGDPTWKPADGIPDDHVMVEEKPDTGSGGSRRGGYTYQVPSALGVQIIDGATGETLRTLPNKLGAGAEDRLTKIINVNQGITRIYDRYDSDKIGVLAGRLNNLDQKFWGSDPEYAAFQQSVQALANEIIHLRTGAQMSIPESIRILGETPNITLPPSTFMARLDEMDVLFKDYLKTASRLGFGTGMTKESVEALMRGEVPERSKKTPTPADGTGKGPTGPAVGTKGVVNGVPATWDGQGWLPDGQ